MDFLHRVTNSLFPFDFREQRGHICLSFNSFKPEGSVIFIYLLWFINLIRNCACKQLMTGLGVFFFLFVFFFFTYPQEILYLEYLQVSFFSPPPQMAWWQQKIIPQELKKQQNKSMVMSTINITAITIPAMAPAPSPDWVRAPTLGVTTRKFKTLLPLLNRWTQATKIWCDVSQGYQLCYDKSDYLHFFYEFQVIYFSYQSVF